MSVEPIDFECMAEFIGDLIDLVPTEATYRNQTINVRFGDTPRSVREMILSGMEVKESAEILIKAEYCVDAPEAGETITINSKTYKIGNPVVALGSVTSPAGWRLVINRVL
ncbi:MAG: hypothetical protein Q7S40_03520 [Opitutaceae bacterium]|nr:hypothetical protein [Opitutaceae bacterium]